MNQDKDADEGEAPDADDRLTAKRPVHSLPGPPSGSSPAALGPPSPTVREDTTERAPAAEISVSPGRVFVTVDLPGASKDTIEVTATDRRLTIHAPRGTGPGYRAELDLPVRVQAESAKATYRNGVLDITLSRIRSSGGADHDG